MKLQANEWGGFQKWQDAFGEWKVSDEKTQQMASPALRLIRYDDAWRPLGAPNDRPLISLTGETSHADFEDCYGGGKGRAYGVPPGNTWPNYWPPSLDLWTFPSDLTPHDPMRFRGTVRTMPVHSGSVEGVRFTIRIDDLRNPANPGPQGTIRMPVGIEMPVPQGSRVFGTEECYEHADVLEADLKDPSLPGSWYYLESELFGMRQDRPEADSFVRPSINGSDLRVGAPLAAFSSEGRLWTAIASEPDYGAAVLWGRRRVRFFSTLYLPPGKSAEWSFVVWRSECREPSQLLLQATLPGGFFDSLNPLGFDPKGSPEGPILFGNVSRLAFQLDQVRALQPGLVLLNYHYDHISSTANLYGSWKTYEGFDYSEEKLRKLIDDLRDAGAKSVGCYGTQVEQPDSHRVIREDDIVLDQWGRRMHAWEPGNWVIDAGNRDCAERLAKAEAEMCEYYGLDAVFVDRIDHCGTNANPARLGKAGNVRLQCIPSIRLGIIELNRERMKWMRRLNPTLRVGLNNTTGWAGVRYSDWNQLEGGNSAKSREISWLMQPCGVVDKRHTTPLFSKPSGPELFQVIGETGGTMDFSDIMRRFIGESLFGGVEACPYGDEWFVETESMFFDPSNSNSKHDLDEVKLSKIQAFKWNGGFEWRAMWESVCPALDASRTLATPVARTTSKPDKGIIPEGCRFHGRTGIKGGVYVAVRNDSNSDKGIDIEYDGVSCHGPIPAKAVRAWWLSERNLPVGTLWHKMEADG